MLNDLRHIVRCYDFFIACHPLMPIYLAAAVSITRMNAMMQHMTINTRGDQEIRGKVL